MMRRATDAGPARHEPVPRFLVLNRYDDEDALYARHCADVSCELLYVTLRECRDALEAEPRRVRAVDDLEYETVLKQARVLADEGGPFDGVVGLSEYDVLTAARVRDAMAIPGPSADLVLGFRDKVEMKRRVAGAGLRVPAYVPLTCDTSADDVVQALGLPVVLKPRARAGSIGVQVVTGAAELDLALRNCDRDEYECEQFVSTEIYHVDGVMSEGRAHFVSASGYVNTPLDFISGKPLGSVLLDPGALRTQLIGFAIECIGALGLQTGCFHMEIVRSPIGEPVFLEAALRPGGALVCHLHRDVYGVDLMSECFRTSLGLPLLSADSRHFEYFSAGWVVVPEPMDVPAVVVSRTPMEGRVPQVYAETLPRLGQVFDGTGGYWRVPGAFRLAGTDERSVRAAARRVMSEYRTEFGPVSAVRPSAPMRGD